MERGAIPAGGQGRPPLRKCILRCVGEGLCPSRGRGRTPPLRSVARSAVGRADVGIGPYGHITRGAGRAESLSYGFAGPAPFMRGGGGYGDRDSHSQCAHWLRNDTLYERRYESGRATARVAPTERNKKCHGRADVGIGPYEDVTSSAGQVRAAGLQEVR